MMRGMRKIKRRIEAGRRTAKRRLLSKRVKSLIARRKASKHVPKKLIARIMELKIPLEEKITLYRGFAEIFKGEIDKDGKEYLLERAIKMLDTNGFPKFLHNVNAKLVVARLKMIANLLKPRERFSFRHKAEHRFPDGYIERDVFVLESPKIGEIAIFSLHLNPVLNKNYVWFVQGVKGVDMKKVPRYIGKPWYRAIIDEIIRSARELYKAGGEIRVKYSGESTVYDKIWEEYLKEEQPKGSAAGRFFPLDRNKKRVAKLFEELGIVENKK